MPLIEIKHNRLFELESNVSYQVKNIWIKKWRNKERIVFMIDNGKHYMSNETLTESLREEMGRNKIKKI